jgi:hypothetical protein
MGRFASYLRGLDAIGAVANPASDYGDGYMGPLSPDQLAQLDRKLTDAEQAAVSASQGAVADTLLKQERAKGGPQSATVEVTPKGATIKALPVIERKVVRQMGIPWWQIALAVAGAGAMGYGFYRFGSRGGGESIVRRIVRRK